MTSQGRFLAFEASLTLELELRATGALLIRGQEVFAPDAPDMAFVRYPLDGAGVPFVPGSSLKGVLRSSAESLLRALGRHACEDRHDRCLACLTFGSTAGGSVVLVDDGMPWPPGASPEERTAAIRRIEAARTVRTGVGIDRQVGAVAVGPFDYEVLVQPTFFPVVRLRNPKPWQAALLAAAVALLHEGHARLGAMTSRGLGRVEVACRGIELLAAKDRVPELWDETWSTEPAAGPFVRRRSADPTATLAAWQSQLEAWLGGEE